jgi:hypothetical protein
MRRVSTLEAMHGVYILCCDLGALPRRVSAIRCEVEGLEEGCFQWRGGSSGVKPTWKSVREHEGGAGFRHSGGE